MARFYGSVKGSRGGVHRLGSPGSGLRVVAAGWDGAVCVTLHEKGGKDHARVELMPWRGAGESRVLYDGPVGGRARRSR
jgi:hypothetical protein